MADPKEQAATQLRNIEASTGTTIAEYAALVDQTGLQKHGQIVAFLKADHGLTHGNANLLVHTIRERASGGPASAEDLLDAQYAKGKAALRPVYERLAEVAVACGDDVDMVVQKTGVSFRRAKQFALVQALSAKRIQVGLNFSGPPPNERAEPATGMCTHRVNVAAESEIDDALVACIAAAYESAAGVT